ncbi:MAG: hypothetical protein ACKOXB_06935 [Flavobacteriales bacterium]
MNKIFLFTGCLAIALVSCNPDDASTAEATVLNGDTLVSANDLPSLFAMNDSLFRKLDKPYDRFVIKSDKGAEIKLANGSSLSIPTSCFVDSANNKITGDVEIEYREIKTAAEVILSGITMVYDSASHKHDFQTAGMFEFRAYQNGKALKFAENKKVNVSMATNQKDNNYNFYRLNDDCSNWTYLSTTHNESNIPESFLQSAGLASSNTQTKKEGEVYYMEEPTAPNKLDESRPVFDLSFDLNEHPELLGLAGLMWQYAGDDMSKDPCNNKKFLETKWTKVNIRPIASRKGAFYVDLSCSTAKMSTEARPVLQGKPYEKAYDDYVNNLKKYKAFLVKQEQERHAAVANVNTQQRTVNQSSQTTNAAATQRTSSASTQQTVVADNTSSVSTAAVATNTIDVQIVDVGFYNCDRIYSRPDAVRLIADFDVPVTTENSVMVYLIASDLENVIITYPMRSWKNFVYASRDENMIVALLNDGRVATLSAKEFKAIKHKDFKNDGTSQYTFKLHLSEKPIESAAELDEIIAKL